MLPAMSLPAFFFFFFKGLCSESNAYGMWCVCRLGWRAKSHSSKDKQPIKARTKHVGQEPGAAVGREQAALCALVRLRGLRHVRNPGMATSKAESVKTKDAKCSLR